MFVVSAARLGSLNALQQRMREWPRQWRGFLGEGGASADTIGRVASDNIGCDQLRQMLADVTKILRRRKAIHPLLKCLPFRVAPVDAHELFAADHHCCKACRVRRVWKGRDEKKRNSSVTREHLPSAHPHTLCYSPSTARHLMWNRWLPPAAIEEHPPMC